MFNEFYGFSATPFARGLATSKLYVSSGQEDALTNERKKTPVIIVDEAHLVDQRMLEEMRLLLNVRMDSQAAAALVLVGHTELRRTLRLSINEALWQRTGIRYHLKPLNLTETGAYIRHQLDVTGYRGPGLSSDGFVAKAYDYTKGVPRQINLVCTHALMAGCADQKQVLDETVLRQVINDLETASS